MSLNINSNSSSLTKANQPADTDQSNSSGKQQKYIALGIWGGVLAFYLIYSYTNNLSPLDTIQLLIEWMSASIYGPLIFIIIYMLRPVLFFSATLLTLASGYLFGPVWGVIYTVIGSNLSASIAYAIGRYFGQNMNGVDQFGSLAAKYADRLRKNSFETVLIMRFVFLPYDLVNYLAGFLQIRWRSFAIAGMLGALPGTVSFALFGSSIEGNFQGGAPEFNPTVIFISIVIFISSLGFSRYLKQRENQPS